MGEKKIEKLSDKKEIALRFGVTVRAVENWMKDQGLPYYKLGAVVRFKVHEVDKWLSERRVVNSEG